MKIFKLSHYLTNKTPLYGSTPAMKSETFTDLTKGDSSNTHIVQVHNHTGTHVDVAFHFRADGKKISDYPDQLWTFDRVMIADVPKLPDSMVSVDDIGRYESAIKNCDVLLIRTGHEKYRNDDPDTYRLHGPGIAPELALRLRSHENLRAVGIDAISVTSFQHRQLGRETHRNFFSPEFPDNFMLIEDMHLAGIPDIDQLIIEPYFWTGIDGSPVTILATSK